MISWCAVPAGIADDINPSYEYLLSPQSGDIETALSSNDWQRGSGHASFGYHDQDTWLRYDLGGRDRVHLFVIANPWLTRFDFYASADGQVVEKYEMGSAQPMRARPYAAKNFVVPLQPGIDTVYIYDYGRSTAIYPVYIETPQAFANTMINLHTIHGLYYGIVLIMVLYSLALFVGTTDRAYLYYSGYAASLVVFLSTADGSGSFYLWPELPQAQQLVTTIALAGVLTLITEFCIKFLNTATHTPKLTQLMRIGQVTVLVHAAATVLFPGPFLFGLQPAVSFITLALLLWVTIVRVRHKDPSARIFLLANGMMASGSMVMIGVTYGFIQPGWIVQHSIHIGSVLELAFLSGALIHRLRVTEQLRWRAFKRSEELSRRNKELAAAQAMTAEHAELQKSLQHAQKLKTIGEMAGGFAHDFNNILASILGFSELAVEKSKSADRTVLVRYLSEIQNAGKRGASLVKQLLVYSRNTHFDPRELNLNEIIKQGSELLRGSLPATVDIDTSLPSRPVISRIDSEQVQQVLVNLSLNAAEAMNERGRIKIQLASADVDNLHCTSCLERFSGSFVALKVEDNGPGIDGSAEELFTPFHTTKTVGKGSGLGLSVVHGIVHEHHGHVHASNRAEGGARFVVYLPLAEMAKTVDDGRKRVLLVEDDPSVAAYLTELLNQDSFATTVTNMPTEALEAFLAEPDAYDLVITDYAMPEGTGIDIAHDIRILRPDLPVILTTGNANAISDRELDTAGIRAVFTKPLNSEQLLAKIRGLLAA